MCGMQPLALGAAMAAGAQAHIDIQGGPDARSVNNPAYYQHSEESKKLAMVRALHQAEGIDRVAADGTQNFCRKTAPCYGRAQAQPCGGTQAATHGCGPDSCYVPNLHNCWHVPEAHLALI